MTRNFPRLSLLCSARSPLSVHPWQLTKNVAFAINGYACAIVRAPLACPRLTDKAQRATVKGWLDQEPPRRPLRSTVRELLAFTGRQCTGWEPRWSETSVTRASAIRIGGAIFNRRLVSRAVQAAGRADDEIAMWSLRCGGPVTTSPLVIDSERWRVLVMPMVWEENCPEFRVTKRGGRRAA